MNIGTNHIYKIAAKRGGLALRSLRNLAAFENPRAIFVTGNQKSGTSAIAALLSKATNRTACIDFRAEIIDPMFHKVISGHKSIDQFLSRNRYHLKFDIIKEPNFTLLYEKMRQVRPGHRWVFVMRDPYHNIRSILNRIGIRESAVDIDVSANISQTWRLIVEGEIEAWRTGNYVERLAHRWVRCANVYLRYKEEFSLIKYEDFLVDKECAIANLASELNIDVCQSISDCVDTQFQPAGERFTSLGKFFGSRHIESISEICQDTMRKLDYSDIEM